MAFDPDQFISGVRPALVEPAPEEKKKSSGFDPDAYINSGVSQAPTSAELGTEQTTSGTEVAGMVASPAVTAAGFSGPAISPMAVYEQGISPFAKAGVATAGKYIQNPVKAGIDVAAMFMGSPVPPVGTIEMGKTLKNIYGAGQEVASNIDQALSKLPKGIDVEAATFLRGLGPEDQSRLLSEINTKGLDRALKEFQPPAYLDEAGRNALSATQKAIPSGIDKLGRAIAPVARTAARVLGPAGMAYDAYQAQQFAEESQVGPRLAKGEGAIAPQAFRNMNVPYGQGFTNSMTPDQASAVLESGSARDIQAFGGQDYLTQLIRKKAAERVLGPIAP